MSEERLSPLYGRMQKPVKYSARRRPIPKPPLPPRNPKEHRDYLLGLLDKTESSIKSKQSKKVEGATHSLIAVKVHPGSEVKLSSLETRKEGVRVILRDDTSNIIILDTPGTELKALRRKIEAYGSKSFPQTRCKGTANPANNDLVAPIDKIELARFKLIWSLNLRKYGRNLDVESLQWFEVSCRGGIHDEEAESQRSRSELKAGLELLGLRNTGIPEYLAPERIIFFFQCSLKQLQSLFELTDCIFEVEMIQPMVLNWLFAEKISVTDLPKITSIPPAESAPAVVVLDSGINSKHSLLGKAVALECSVHPEDNSSVDVIGHGTEMAGIALYGDDVQRVVANGEARPSHWIDSVRIFTHDKSKIHSKDGRPFWAKMIEEAVKRAVSDGHRSNCKVFSLAITSEQEFPGTATSWSLAVDQLAYNEGSGRLFCISIGNCKDINRSFLKNFPQENLLRKIEDPAQAFNAITIGGFTSKVTLPPDKKYGNLKILSKAGEISPHTRSGRVADVELPIKPDVVFEAGNFAYDDTFVPDSYIPTLASLSSGHNLSNPYVITHGTSMATALAAKFVADLWKIGPKLRPETIRALLVHSASWTKEMKEQFRSKDDLISVCGYGVPSFEIASYCTRERATVLIEDTLSNQIRDDKGSPGGRQMKVFRLPLPEKELTDAQNKQVELRVTLSYFAEPNSALGKSSHGMDLGWDIQGPYEKEDQFLKRINDAMRGASTVDSTKGFKNWHIGPQRRNRGTVQSDRWTGPASDLAGAKLIAVYPRYGWWNRRKKLAEKGMSFALVVSVLAPGIEVYNHIKTTIEVPTPVEVEIGV